MENDHLVERNQRLFDNAYPTAYNEAIPNNINFVDAFEIDLTGFDFANQWITALLGQRTTSLNIQPSSDAIRKIEHLYFNARNSVQIKGYKNLGFGYPILSKKDGQAASGFMAAPIFIWSIQLDPDATKEYNWQVKVTDHMSVRLNPILAELDPRVGVLTERFNKKIAKKGVNLNLCNQFCEGLAEILNYQNDRPNYSIEKFPDIVDLSTIQGNGAIVYAGVFTAFPPVHFYALTDSILSKEYWQEPLEQRKAEDIQFSYLACDHQQKAAQLAVSKHKFVLIEGAAGSGKNHTIANFLINNLLNGERTLLVSPSVVELEKLENKLLKEGFDEYAFLFRNLDLDKDNLVEQLGAKVEKANKGNVANTDDFLLTYKRFGKLNHQLEKAAEVYAKNIFDINNWTESVGLYLKNSRSESKDLLDTQLNVNDFSFDFIEYEQTKEKIKESQRLFQETFSFYHALDELADHNFEEEDLKLAKTKLDAKLRKFLKKTRQLQREFLTKIGWYKTELEEHHERQFETLNNQIESTQDFVDQLTLQFGTEYHKTSVSNLKIFKTFSGKSKTALALKSKILKQFEQLKSIYFEQPSFDFEFLETASEGNIEVLSEQLIHFQGSLNDWRIKNQSAMQESVKNLNSKTVFTSLKYAGEITYLEDALSDLIVEINESQLFIKSFKDNSMTLQLKQQLLDEIIDRLNSCLHGIRDFDTFFEWRKLTSTFTATEQKVMKSLIKVRPTNWLSAFDAWYFHNLLTKESHQSGNFELLLTDYLKQHKSLTKKVPNFIEKLWHKKFINTISSTKKQGRSTYNSLLKKSVDRTSFATYFKIHLARISNFYPILMMTTEMAKTVLDGALKTKFDHLILKSGAGLTKEEGGGLLNLAHQVQVFETGNERHTLQPNSFWNLARSLAGKQIALKSQHRNTGNSIMAFNNAAFDQQLKVVLAEDLETDAINIHAVDGDYDIDLKTNDAECRSMLSLLTEIKGTPQHTYPKVGFVCATVEQRNLFSAYLLRIKQSQANGWEKIKHLERNGMRVFSFEELSGQRFDILFVSFTYGVVDTAGNVSKEIDYLGTPQGENLLQQLFNSVTQQIIVCHSFPKSFIQAKQQLLPKNGLSILAAFMDYGKVLAKNNRPALIKILTQLSRHKTVTKISEKMLFMDEVAHYLAAYFEPDRILRNQQIKGQTYPLVIKGEAGDPIQYVVQADSFFNQKEVFSFTWQQQLNQAMESAGYKFLTIWSKDWWRQPEKEARKLASRIIRVD